MGLLSLFKRNDEPPAEPLPTPDAVAQARAQARRRLIGATVLLAIGVIGFPLLFETQPRPVHMDIPIEIPRKEGAPPLAMPPAVAPPAAAVTPPADAPLETPAAPSRPVAQASAPAKASTVITERAGEQGREVSPTAAKPASVAAAPASKPAAAAASPAATASARAPATAVDDGARARAILEGQPLPPVAAAPASAPATRVIVQVGAYTDEDKLREVRQKVEKLGLKTYTQVVEIDDTRRTRVRVGPFPTRAEADKVAAKLKAAGLPTTVLTL